MSHQSIQKVYREYANFLNFHRGFRYYYFNYEIYRKELNAALMELKLVFLFQCY